MSFSRGPAEGVPRREWVEALLRVHRVPNVTSNVGVLIADDSAMFLGAGIAVVESTPGFDLLGTAESGEQAIEVAAKTQPDLVLIDVRMPGIGGLEAARRIHELQPSVVLILITAEELQLEDGDAVAALLDKRVLCTAVLAELWRQHGQDRSGNQGGVG